MTVWVAMLLGLVQGLTEFLPVSSSGHLVLLQTVFGIEAEGSLFFDTMLHVGSLVAVFAVFYKQVWDMLRHPIQKKVGLLLIATAVTTLFAFLFQDLIEAAFGGAFLGFGFLLTALILFLNERLAHGKKTIDHMKPLEAAGVGLMQAVAIFPAISRSGSTIAGSRFFGLKKEDAAEFSFLLSIPAILGAALLQLKDVVKLGAGGVEWAPVLFGMLTAMVSGYFAIRFMLRLIVKKSLMGFMWYVAALGVLVLLDQLVFNVFFSFPF